MNIFRTIATKAPRNRGKLEQVVPESGQEQAANVQHPRSPVGDGATKAEEMLHFMAERRDRLKKK